MVWKMFPVTTLVFTTELEEQGYNATTITSMIRDDSSKLYEAMASSAGNALFSKSFGYPLDKITNVGAFGNIRKSGNTSPQHLGVDLNAALDTNVYAINDGIVKATLNLADYGNTYGNAIVIDHGLGIFFLFLYLNKFKVTGGAKSGKRTDYRTFRKHGIFHCAPSSFFDKSERRQRRSAQIHRNWPILKWINLNS